MASDMEDYFNRKKLNTEKHSSGSFNIINLSNVIVVLILIAIGGSIGWLVGLHFWMIFKIIGIIAGGYLIFISFVLYGFSGNIEGSSILGILGISFIIGMILAWLAVEGYTFDVFFNSIIDLFSVPEQ